MFSWFTSINNDRNNRLLYSEVGTVRNGILTSKDIDIDIEVDVVRKDNTTIVFIFTTHDDEDVIANNDDSGNSDSNSNKVNGVNKQTTNYSWNLSDPKFSGIKMCKVVHKHLSCTAWYLKQLFSMLPDVKCIIDNRMVELTYPPSLTLSYLGNENNVLLFGINHSSDPMDYMIRSLCFKEYRLTNFGDINSKTTLSTKVITNTTTNVTSENTTATTTNATSQS